MAKSNHISGLSEKPGRFIIAIGASAGGLEAIHEFFDHMPANTGLTFVVIQHLSPDYKSLLVELVSKHTHMKVYEAENDMALQRDCVYIIPNKKLMTLRGNKLKLADKIKDKSPNTAIDTFLFTLAKERKDKAIAIILSGTGTDGTKGTEAVKECGGMVVVQDPATAKFDGMPNSAISAGNADVIVPPSQMYEEVYSYIHQQEVPAIGEKSVDDRLLNEVFTLVSNSSGQDFNLYKTPTILRRIARRMSALEIDNLDDYVAELNRNADEVKLLAKDFLIGVTKFFRDSPAFEILAKDIIPNIVKSKEDGDILKVWVCACSTGEEAYSIAILIDDHLKKVGKNLEVKIFATDVDEASIEIAARNHYPLTIAKEIDNRLLKSYFVKENKSYTIIPSIRRQIVFARHDVIKSPPFIKNDLVTCRNMLIYMNTVLQQKVISTFHYALKKDGYLFLGSSENAAGIKDGVTEISSKWKIYQKSGNINYGLHHSYTTVAGNLKYTDKKTLAKKIESPKTLEEEYRDLVVEEFSPVGIFIDRNYTVRETMGNFNDFLKMPEKKLDLNILNMVSREISVVLNTAVRKAWKENKKIQLKKIKLKRGKDEVNMQITVKPPESRSTSGYTLILFSEAKIEQQTSGDGILLPPVHGEGQQDYLMEMEAELSETRTNLQMAMEEMETTNEELQSSNEELLSANEELQSGNEELQSLNEELHTLNTEHQLKIRELVELNDDLDNYFRSTDIGQIFVDGSLRIRKFNPAAIHMVNLIDADVGRPIHHISSNILYDNLVNDIHQVLSKAQLVEKEVELLSGKNFLMRIMPYLRKDKKPDGVVITFVDISVVTELNNIIAGVFNASASAILAFKEIKAEGKKTTDFECVAYNHAALHILAKAENEVEKNLSIKQIPALVKDIKFEQYLKVFETQKHLQAELQTEDGKWFQLICAPMNEGIVLSLTDVTVRKNAEQKLRTNYHELITAREGLRTLNQQLEQKVQERTQSLSESEERFNLVSTATNDTIWDWNLVTNTMWRSDNFSIMFGYNPSEAGKNIDFWFEKIHPDDRERVEQSVYQAINDHQPNWSQEYRFLKADGSYAIILDRGSIQANEFGTPYRMVGSIIDITRLAETENLVKKQQEEFHNIFKNAPALIYIKRGPELVYEFVNKSFEAFEGRENVIGLKAEHVSDELLAIEKKVLETGIPFEGKAYPLKALKEKDAAEDRWFDIICTPVFDNVGKKDGVAFFGFEVTDLVKGRMATEELMHKKDEFMSIASHELKTPITSLKGSLQLAQRLLSKSENKVLTGFIDKAEHQTEKLTVLVNDLLDVTKIQEGKMLLNYSTFDVVAMIKECVDDVRAQKIKHQIIILDDCPIEIHADRARLEQVVNNFLTNAIKYSPHADEVKISCVVDDGELKVSVQDFGIGIPADKQQFLFDRFYRVQESSVNFSGLGLGLFISAEIIKRHHGEVGISSEMGKGATFWFSLPLNKK